MSEQMTADGLCALVGCSASTLSRWVSRGLPCTRERTGHGGAKKLLFNREAALRWIAENASISSAQMARALTAKASPEPPPEPAAAIPDPNAIDDEGLLPCLERLKKTERESFKLLQRLKKSGDIGGVRVVGERFVNECRALAAMEQAALNYRTRAGELGPRREMQGVFERVIISIKNAVLGIPSNVIPQLIPYLRDPEQAHAVNAILDRASRDALRAASEKHTRPKP